MIVELSIRNFAIIEALQIQFHEGFNVLTGETGAGKSILLDALGLLLGNRGSSDWVRHGEKKAEIEGLFNISENTQVKNKLITLGIDFDEDMIVIRRELNVQGKSICRLNGQLVTISMLREIGDLLVNFHSQHDHHQLTLTVKHLTWLDAYGGTDVSNTLREYQQLYRKFIRARKEYEHLNQSEKEMAHRLDLLKYQMEEIQRASLEVGEEEKLREERSRLIHREKITKHVNGAYEALAGEQKTLDWLGMAMSHLEEVAHLESSLKEKFIQVEEVFYLIEEITRELSHYSDQVENEDGRLSSIEERLDTIQGLKRKYGDSILSIMEYAASIEDELERLENKDSLMSSLYEQLIELKKDLLLEARELSRTRQTNALALANEVMQELKDLHMERATFQVFVEDLMDQVNRESLQIPGGEFGMNSVEFMISSNPGEPLKPLVKIASGGELSRIALALRTVLARLDEVGTLVFDEVDTGVSGRVSQAIGEKLYRISRKHQVLAITHHPQVAALADKHFSIMKEVRDGRTETKVITLSEDERVEALARMVGGAEISSSARIHAAEMLRLGRQYKQNHHATSILS